MTFVLNGLSIIDQTRKANVTRIEGPSNLNGSQRSNYVPVVDWTIDCAVGNYFIKTVNETGGFTFINTSDTETYQCIIEIDHAGGAIGWPDNLHWYNNIQPPTLIPSRTHYIMVVKHRNATSWIANILPNYRSYYPILDTPMNFDIPTVTEAQLDSDISSAEITVIGLEPNYPVTITGYGGKVESATIDLTGALANQQTVMSSDMGTIVLRAQLRTSPKELSETLMNITVNKGSAQWRVITKSIDMVPDMFTFQDKLAVDFNDIITSNPITITGLEPGIQFKLTTTGGTIAAGTDTIPSVYGTVVDVTSSAIGTIVASARAISGRNEYTTSVVDIILSSPVATTQTATTWTIITRGRKLTPNPISFIFPTTRGIELGATVQSSTIQLTGLEPNYQFTVTAENGLVDGGPSRISGLYEQTKLLSTNNNGSLVVSLQSVAGTEPDVDNICRVTVGTSSALWKYRTVDLIPDSSSLGFTTITGADFNRIYISNVISVTGLEPNRAFVIASQGGEFDAGMISLSGQYTTSRSVVTSASGTLKLIARQTTSFSEQYTNSVDITIGTMSTSWLVTTRVRDVIPNPESFVFAAKSGVEFNAEYTSETIVLTGLEPSYNFTISAIGGLVDAGSTTLSGTFAPSVTVTTTNQGTCAVAARTSSGSNQLTATSVSVAVGTERTLWTITTRAFDEVPDVFSFDDVSDGITSQEYTSNMITITGLEPNHNITVSSTFGIVDAGTYNLSGAFLPSIRTNTTPEGTLVVAVRATASAIVNDPLRVDVEVGGGTTTWTITPTQLV